MLQPLLLSALAVCHALAPSLALSFLCPHTPFLAPVLSFPRVSPRIQTPVTHDHPHPQCATPKMPAPSPNLSSFPSPPICKKVWVVTWGPKALDVESQLLLLSRRFSASLLSDLSSGLVTRGPPPGPSHLHVWAPSPGFRPPAVMNGTAVPLGRKTPS